jgi:hypothetical protein
LLEVVVGSDDRALVLFGLVHCCAERGHKRLRDSGSSPTEFDEFLRKYHQVLGQA